MYRILIVAFIRTGFGSPESPRRTIEVVRALQDDPNLAGVRRPEAEPVRVAKGRRVVTGVGVRVVGIWSGGECERVVVCAIPVTNRDRPGANPSLLGTVTALPVPRLRTS